VANLAHHVSGSDALGAQSRKCRQVDGVTCALANELNGSHVVITAIFLSFNQRSNELANQRRDIKLITTRATGHKEPIQARLVVLRTPVVGDVVQRTDAKQFEWHTKVWQTTCEPQHHSLKKLDSD